MTASDTQSTDAQSRRVKQWRGIFDLLYRGGDEQFPAGLNISGWQSVYSRDLIPLAEMEEWLEQTVARIHALSPRRVLEIGCGTGMILQKIAPTLDAYLGLDISQESINYLRRLGLESGRIRLQQAAADQLDDIERNFFDTVVINSVIQYFPDTGYLEKVLRAAIDVLGGQGCIFLGDARHLGFLEAMQTEIAVLQADGNASTDTLRSIVQQKVDKERELLFLPSYFSQLKALFPEITAVETLLKTGVRINELNKYRYDVVLRLGQPPSTTSPSELNGHVDEMAVILALEKPPFVRVANVANAALHLPLLAVELLKRLGSAGEVRAQLQRMADSTAKPPHDWTIWAKELGYRASLVWSPGADDGCFDLWLTRMGEPARILAGAAPIAGLSPSVFANDPMRNFRSGK